MSATLTPRNPHATTDRHDTASPEDQAILWDLEERFWTEGADSARKMTAKDAVFIFPYPAGILQGGDLWRDKNVAQRWRAIEMTDRYLAIRGVIAVLAYRVAAERGSDPVHVALCSSTYLKDGAAWLRMAHQETPALAEPH